MPDRRSLLLVLGALVLVLSLISVAASSGLVSTFIVLGLLGQ